MEQRFVIIESDNVLAMDVVDSINNKNFKNPEELKNYLKETFKEEYELIDYFHMNIEQFINHVNTGEMDCFTREYLAIVTFESVV